MSLLFLYEHSPSNHLCLLDQRLVLSQCQDGSSVGSTERVNSEHGNGWSRHRMQQRPEEK